MRLHLFASFIAILLLIIRFDAARFDASAADDVDPGPDSYKEYYLKFENWMKLTEQSKENGDSQIFGFYHHA